MRFVSGAFDASLVQGQSLQAVYRSPGLSPEAVAPVLEALKGKLSVPVSVDTFYESVAEWSLEQGASIINDVSGRVNHEMLRIVKEHGAGYIIMHCEGLEQPITDKLLFLAEQANKAGIDRDSICLDIGIGFHKNTEENIDLLRHLKEIKPGGYPLLIGASRKRFIGAVSGEETPENRDAGTIAAHTLAIAAGADIIRVHEVKPAVQAARVADRIVRFLPQEETGE